MQNPVIIFGAQAIGRQVKEIFDSNEVVVYGFLDDNKSLHKTELDEALVLGSTDDDGFLKLVGKKCEAFVAIDDIRLRKSIVKMLNEVRHVQPVNAVHRQALISSRASLGHGCLIDARVVVQPGVSIGDHAIIHAGANIGAEARLGQFVQVGMGTTLNPGVEVGDEVFIGSGVTIVSGVTIGKGARVGAGSVVVSSVKPGETVFGNPAQPVKS